MHEYFRDRQIAPLRVEVADPVPRHPDRPRRVEPVRKPHPTGFEGEGGVEDLERRPHLVDAERDPVEALRLLRSGSAVGVEIGERAHRQHFAGRHVEDQPGGAGRAVDLHPVAQSAAQRVLDPHVDRQRQRSGARAQLRIEPSFDAGEPVPVRVGEPDRVRRQRAGRVDPTLLAPEFEARDAEPVDRVLLVGRQMPAQHDVAPLAGEPGRDRLAVEVGQDRGQRRGGPLRRGRAFRIGDQRGRRQVGGEDEAVAVGDLGPHRRAARRALRAGLARLHAALDGGHVDQPDADHREHREHRRPGQQHPGAAGIDGLLALPVEAERAGGMAPPHGHRHSSAPAAKGRSETLTTCPGPGGRSARRRRAMSSSRPGRLR